MNEKPFDEQEKGKKKKRGKKVFVHTWYFPIKFNLVAYIFTTFQPDLTFYLNI